MMARVFYTFCFILIILIGILPVYLYGQNIHQEDTKELRARAESRYLADTHKIPIRRYFHSTEIKPDEVINGHVVVVKGDLGIWGKVNGDVLTLYGDVEVFDNSAVNGNITSVGGRVILHDNGKVEGNMLETHWKNLLTDQNSFLRFHSYDNYTPYSKFEIPDSDHQIALRYNRVEGVFLGLEVPRQWRYPTAHLSGYGFVGYGFESKDIRYQIGLDRWFIDSMDYRTEIGAEYHDLTDTKDLWRVGYTENSLAAVFFKQDYHDYFRRKGFSVYLRQNLTRAFLIGIEYRNDDYESLRSNTNWALFGGDKNFRRNPLLGGDEGTMRSIYTEISLDTRDNFEHPRKGWYINLSAETSSPQLESQFDFNRYLLDFRRYQPVTRGERIRLRMMAGTSEGALPLQKNFELGGISTLRAFNYKAFSGNRMFLTNVEYVFDSDILGSFLGINHFNLIIFGDVGDVWSSGNDERVLDSFRSLSLAKIKSDIGIGIADGEEHFRINFAKRTDRSDNDIIVTLRINQPF